MSDEQFLDLTEEIAPTRGKVKLPPDGLIFDMANPDALSPTDLQKLLARSRRAEELEGQEDSTTKAAELLEVLVDLSQMIAPDAPRDYLVRVPIPVHQRLAESFFGGLPAPTPNRAARRAKGRTTGK